MLPSSNDKILPDLKSSVLFSTRTEQRYNGGIVIDPDLLRNGTSSTASSTRSSLVSSANGEVMLSTGASSG